MRTGMRQAWLVNMKEMVKSPSTAQPSAEFGPRLTKSPSPSTVTPYSSSTHALRSDAGSR